MGELLNGQVERLMARTQAAEDEVRQLRTRVAALEVFARRVLDLAVDDETISDIAGWARDALDVEADRDR